MGQNAQAKSSLPACANTIMDCGCDIKTSGDYTVGAALTTSSTTEDCIDISAANVNLAIGSFNLTGAGPGSTNVGINVISSAKNANLQFDDDHIESFGTGIQVAAVNAILNDFSTDDNAGNGLVIDGAAGSAIFDFEADDNGGVGVLINKGSKLQILDFEATEDTGGGISLVSSKGVQLSDFFEDDGAAAGISMMKSSGNTIIDFEADENSAEGIVLNGSSGNTINDFEAEDNTTNGIALSGSNGNEISDGDANENGNYGIWLQASSKNLVDFNDGEGNVQTGIYLGCAATDGPTGAACSSVGNSDSNRLSNNYVGRNGVHTQKYGVAIDLGDSGNLVSGQFAPNPDTIDDYIDENPDCDKNVWFDNTGATSSPSSCIPFS